MEKVSFKGIKNIGVADLYNSKYGGIELIMQLTGKDLKEWNQILTKFAEKNQKSCDMLHIKAFFPEISEFEQKAQKKLNKITINDNIVPFEEVSVIDKIAALFEKIFKSKTFSLVLKEQNPSNLDSNYITSKECARIYGIQEKYLPLSTYKSVLEGFHRDEKVLEKLDIMRERLFNTMQEYLTIKS